MATPAQISKHMTGVHDPAACAGRGCSVHGPSEHSMADWDAVWRGDRGFFERVCDHGIGHPDPDDVAYYAGIGVSAGVHGCDGCCS